MNMECVPFIRSVLISLYAVTQFSVQTFISKYLMFLDSVVNGIVHNVMFVCFVVSLHKYNWSLQTNSISFCHEKLFISSNSFMCTLQDFPHPGLYYLKIKSFISSFSRQLSFRPHCLLVPCPLLCLSLPLFFLFLPFFLLSLFSVALNRITYFYAVYVARGRHSIISHCSMSAVNFPHSDYLLSDRCCFIPILLPENLFLSCMCVDCYRILLDHGLR